MLCEQYWLKMEWMGATELRRGAAGVSVITLERGVPYLCKFAVASKAQGQVRGERCSAWFAASTTDTQRNI